MTITKKNKTKHFLFEKLQNIFSYLFFSDSVSSIDGVVVWSWPWHWSLSGWQKHESICRSEFSSKQIPVRSLHEAHDGSIVELITRTKRFIRKLILRIIWLSQYKPQCVLFTAMNCSLQTHRNAFPPTRLQFEFKLVHVPGMQKSPNLCDWPETRITRLNHIPRNYQTSSFSINHW